MTDIPPNAEPATRSRNKAELEQALRLSQMEIAALKEINAALRDTLAMYQRRDQLMSALDTADLQRLTDVRTGRTPTPVS